MTNITHLQSYLYKRLIRPYSNDPDVRRREFILSILLSGLSLLAFLSFISTAIHQFSSTAFHDWTSLLAVPLFLVMTLALLVFCRKGYSNIAGIGLLILVNLMAFYFMLTWSFELPMAQLLGVLGIVFAGVLFTAKSSIIMSSIASVTILVIAYLQTKGIIYANTSWLNIKLDTIDAIGAVAIFSVAGIVTWLANGEIDRSLARARASEASLAQERDNLEIRVAERTRELEEAQVVRLMELQRFAELGKLSAGLLHDVASPLTAASLNLGQLNRKYEPEVVEQVTQSLQHIERYVEAARKQLMSGGEVSTFTPKKEVEQVLNITAHRAKQNKVMIKTDVPARIKLVGDAIKFNQLVANLVINAIESYDDSPLETRLVLVSVIPYRSGIALSVHDQGKGLSTVEKKKIFQSFYTTKTTPNRNMGIGLSLVKQIVEGDFSGSLQVNSSPNTGTTFTAKLFNKKH